MYKVFFKESCFLLTDNQNLLKEGDIRWVHRDFMTTKNFIYQTLEKGIPFKAVLYDETNSAHGAPEGAPVQSAAR